MQGITQLLRADRQRFQDKRSRSRTSGILAWRVFLELATPIFRWVCISQDTSIFGSTRGRTTFAPMANGSPTIFAKGTYIGISCRGQWSGHAPGAGVLVLERRIPSKGNRNNLSILHASASSTSNRVREIRRKGVAVSTWRRSDARRLPHAGHHALFSHSATTIRKSCSKRPVSNFVDFDGCSSRSTDA